MADSSSNDNSTDAGGAPSSASGSSDSNSGWDYSYLNPYGNFIASLPELMPGPLSPQRINGPREFYTDPQAYFAQRNANNGLAGVGGAISEAGQPADGWDMPVRDTIFGGGGNDLVGDAGFGPAAGARTREFDLPYTPAGSLLAGDRAHTGAVPPAPAPAGSLLRGDPDHPFLEDNNGGGDYLTVAKYPGGSGFGHVGIGVNSDTTMGFYPSTKSRLRSIPEILDFNLSGAERPDVYYPPEGRVTIPVSPDQAGAVRDFLNRRVASPGFFNLWNRDCANTVEDALAAAGVKTLHTTFPHILFDSLQEQYTPGAPREP